jgi:hypothetical protein
MLFLALLLRLGFGVVFHRLLLGFSFHALMAFRYGSMRPTVIHAILGLLLGLGRFLLLAPRIRWPPQASYYSYFLGGRWACREKNSVRAGRTRLGVRTPTRRQLIGSEARRGRAARLLSLALRGSAAARLTLLSIGPVSRSSCPACAGAN